MGVTVPDAARFISAMKPPMSVRSTVGLILILNSCAMALPPRSVAPGIRD